MDAQPSVAPDGAIAKESGAVSGKRVASVDGLRGVLATVVLYEHMRGCLFHPYTDAPGQFAVMAFFAMSGYVLTRSWNGDFAAFLARRFCRLWPMFALCLAAGALIIGMRPDWTYFFWYPFVYDPLKSPVLRLDDAMWSLFVEAWAALFMPLIVWSSRSTRRVLAAMAVGLAGFYFVDRCFLYAMLFVVGGFFADYEFNLPMLNGPVLQWLGRISFSLYMTHLLVVRPAEAYLNASQGLDLVLALAVAYAAWLLVEPPSVALSRRVGRLVEAAETAILARRRPATAVAP